MGHPPLLLSEQSASISANSCFLSSHTVEDLVRSQQTGRGQGGSIVEMPVIGVKINKEADAAPVVELGCGPHIFRSLDVAGVHGCESNDGAKD